MSCSSLSDTVIQFRNFSNINFLGMNGVPACDEYVTIHVTPEPEFCYASFETNHTKGCLYEQTMKVLELYRQIQINLFEIKVN